MAHVQQFQFISSIKSAFPSFFTGRKVLEVGSLDINGSARQFFDNCNFTGLDVGPGPGVDIVCPGQDYDAPDGSYDVVVSFEAMEHNPYWRETFQNMVRLCRSSGMVLMTCATLGRKEHGTARTSPADSPLSVAIGWDYYRNLSANDFKKEFRLSEVVDPYGFYCNYQTKDLYFIGFRKDGTVSCAPHGAGRVLRRLALKYYALTLFSPRSLRNMILVRTLGEKKSHACQEKAA